MNDNQGNSVNELIRDALYKNMDIEYGKFTASLNPGCGNIIGVRIPVLRKMAKEIASVNWKEYLDNAVDDTFEEIMLQGLVLGYAKGKIDDILVYTEEFIPKIDNWSVCDTFCNTFKIARRYPDDVWEFLMKYMSPVKSKKKIKRIEVVKPEAGSEPAINLGHEANQEEFRLRFVTIMMMSHFLEDAYIDKVLYAYNTMKNDGYYFKMGIAWGLATAYVKYPDKVMSFMKNNTLDDFTFNKTIQKMQESFRISAEDKKILKAMKR